MHRIVILIQQYKLISEKPLRFNIYCFYSFYRAVNAKMKNFLTHVLRVSFFFFLDKIIEGNGISFTALSRF